METKKIHIGELIKHVAKERGLTNAEIAKRIETTRQNVATILKRDTLDVKQLFTICQALDYDFFEPFRLEKEIKPPQKQKILLQIEIEENKISEVLNVIGKNGLYDVIKQ